MRSNEWESAYRIEELRDIRTADSRNQLVVKSNTLIQRARFNLTMQEQRILMFLISRIKPGDSGLDTYFFSLKEFCHVCGIELEGDIYGYIKDTLKRLSDKSIWINAEWDYEGKHYTGQSLVRWINSIKASETSSAVWIKFHDEMLPYLFQLRESFTQYQLRNILAMNSTYAAALYELLKSYEYLQRPIDFALDELRFMLGADAVKSYDRYSDFRRKVLDIAVREINIYSDLSVTYKPIKNGRKVARIIFAFQKKTDTHEVYKTLVAQESRFNPGQIPGQLSFDEV